MELFVVIDKPLLGRGVFGVFSTLEKAKAYLESAERISDMCEIRPLPVMGRQACDYRVFAAYTYEGIWDTYVLDGLYAKASHASEAVGHKGRVAEFVVDAPDSSNPFSGSVA